MQLELPIADEIPSEEVVTRAFQAETQRRKNPRSLANWYFINRFEAIHRNLASGYLLLDVGCGESLFSLPLVLQDKKVICLDTHWELLKYSKLKAEVNHLATHFILGDTVALPFPNELFHNIIFAEVIEHLLRPEEALSELHRILRMDGRLTVTTPVRPFLTNRSIAARYCYDTAFLLVNDKKPDQHVFEFTPAELDELLSETGFRVLKTKLVDTRLWEKNPFRWTKEHVPLPAIVFQKIDSILHSLNRATNPVHLPFFLRARHMVSVAVKKPHRVPTSTQEQQ